MDDIQNWMRSIHPSRPTTPFTDSSANAAGSSNLNQNRTSTSATKPRRPTVERLSSFFPHLRTSKDFKMSASDQEHEPFYNAKDNVYNPDVDMMANTLLTVSMSNLGKPLGAEYGSFLLHVLEAYRYQKRDLAKAAADLDDVKNMMEQLKLEHERDAELWAKEKATYKAEIKRREVLMVQGKTGMEGVMLARAESVLHKDNASKYAKGAATAAEKRRQAEQAGSSATEQDFGEHAPSSICKIPALILSQQLNSTSLPRILTFRIVVSSADSGPRLTFPLGHAPLSTIKLGSLAWALHSWRITALRFPDLLSVTTPLVRLPRAPAPPPMTGRRCSLLMRPATSQMRTPFQPLPLLRARAAPK